jgi:hypothetical protein
MKKNKLNVLDCGPKLSITDEEGLVVKHSGPNGKNKIAYFFYVFNYF